MENDMTSRHESTRREQVLLEGATIYDPQDENVGYVSHVHGEGDTMQVAVDVGTFLGMGGRTVLIPVTALDVVVDADGEVHVTTSYSKSRIEALPEHHG